MCVMWFYVVCVLSVCFEVWLCGGVNVGVLCVMMCGVYVCVWCVMLLLGCAGDGLW